MTAGRASGSSRVVEATQRSVDACPASSDLMRELLLAYANASAFLPVGASLAAAAAQRSDFRSVSAVWAFVVGACRTCDAAVSHPADTRFVSACQRRPGELAERSKWRRRLQRAAHGEAIATIAGKRGDFSHSGFVSFSQPV